MYTRFQTKTAQKPYPMGEGGTYLYLYGLYKGVPPPPPTISHGVVDISEDFNKVLYERMTYK